ncbi:MAG TPA: class I SAM-dependent methyltransferase [Planctomycetota bacterium]|nr:class I SAM-dependent methyltransferase [Planctomycetota bacterium]
MAEEKLQREKAFHDHRWEDDSSRQPTDKFYSVMEPARAFYRRRVLALCRGKRVLEYGCGTGGCKTGSNSLLFAQAAASVTGIDLSEEAIHTARGNAARNGIAADYRVMNAEALQLPAAAFDVAIGTGILHHLDLPRAYAELARALSDDGHAVFIEPLGHNPLINLYRKRTPTMRTADEHPLLMRDLRLARRHFRRVEARFFNLLTPAAVPLRNTRLFGIADRLLSAMDRALFFALPFLRRYAWAVVLDLSEPRRASAPHGKETRCPL